MDEGATQLADARVTEKVHHRENDGIAVWLRPSRHSYPHANLAAQLHVTA